MSLTDKEPILSFTDEDIDLFFDVLSGSSFNNCITANSIAQSYNVKSDQISESYSSAKTHIGLENSLKDLLPDLESESVRQRLARNGINKKQFKEMVREFEDVMNTTTKTKERDEAILQLEKESVKICNGDPQQFIQMLHLSSLLTEEDVIPILEELSNK